MIKSAWLIRLPWKNDTHWLVRKSFGILHFQSAKLHPLEEWLPLWIQLTRFFQIRWTVECDFTAVCLFFWFVNKYIDNYNFEPSIWYPYVATELIVWIQQGSIHLQIVYDVLPCLFDLYPRPYIVSWTSWVFWVYCSSALFQNQNCSNKLHTDSSDHMPHFPGLQKTTIRRIF